MKESAAALRPSLARGRWIFLRGLARQAGHWGAFPDIFRKALPGVEVLQPDLPGCGCATTTVCPTTVPEILEALRAEVGRRHPAADPGRPVAVLGLSLGGMLVVEWMARYPGELAGAVLVNTSLRGLSPPWRRLRVRGLWHLAGAALASTAAAREAHVYKMVSCRPDLAVRIVADWVALGDIPRGTAWRQLRAAARYQPRALPRPEAMLVLASTSDGMVDPSCSRAVAAAMGAELREHPTAGHDLILDEPEWAAAAIAGWIAERGL